MGELNTRSPLEGPRKSSSLGGGSGKLLGGDGIEWSWGKEKKSSVLKEGWFGVNQPRHWNLALPLSLWLT